MNRRPIALTAGLLLAAGLAGCSQHQVGDQASASISIDGKDQGGAQSIRCQQMGSSWFIDIADHGSSARAIVDASDDKVDVNTVTINGYGGFTGGFWKDAQHSADATRTKQKFTISGTATGLKTGTPGSVDAKFKIDAHC